MHSTKKLSCRHCTYKTALPRICPACNGSYLRSVGMGIEKLESEIARFFPEARVAHYDKETAQVPPSANVLLATQALMKHRGSFKAELAAILNFDALLNQGDFRSAQRAFAHAVHLAQMAASRLIVQSRNTENYCLAALRKWDFKKFYEEELNLRRELNYPPFAHLLLILLRGKKQEDVIAQAQALYELIAGKDAKATEVTEPIEDVTPKLRDQYRYTIMLKGKNLKAMIKTAKGAIKELKKKSVLITLNVDP
jgi:primosomal protein N' (replication factor Y)